MGDLGRDAEGLPAEDRLPWLEPVDEESIEEGVPAGRLIAGLLVALVALGLLVGGVYWLKQRSAAPVVATTQGDTIKAPAEPYKVKSTEADGLQVKGQGGAAYAASEGNEVNGQIDLAAAPETPVTKAAPVPPPATQPGVVPVPVIAAKPAIAAKPVPASKPVPVQVAKAPAPVTAAAAKPAVPVKAAAAPATGGAQIQLGAFASEAKANTAWKSLSGRFAVLSGLSQTVAATEVNGKTFYRLRAAAGSKASDICAKLKVAGETCLVIG